MKPTWRCEYCGNENYARKCVDCGAPKATPMRDWSLAALVSDPAARTKELLEIMRREPTRFRGILGQPGPGRQLRKAICADDMNPDFGGMFLQWYDPSSIIKDIFMGRSYKFVNEP